MPDQLVLGVRVDMVLVAEEAAAMLLGPARIAVLLPQLGGLPVCGPQFVVLVTTVPLQRHRHDIGVDDLPATRHVALGRKKLIKTRRRTEEPASAADSVNRSVIPSGELILRESFA
jgi:hypothetical protein